METTENKLNHLVTYSLEDDKIRVYFESRISKEDWTTFKEQGFSWTMKQESDLVAYWTPARQDFALKYCNQTIEDLQDEQSTLLERSCDRAERFSIYREKRLNDSIKHLDNTQVIGMQSVEKAEKIADRIEKQREKANNQFSKCSYWHSRIDSVIAHAIFKESPSLRQRRIRTLTKDKAKHEKDIVHFQTQLAKYQNMTDLEFSEIKFRDNAKPSKDEIILKIENILKNGHATRWLEHLNFRIDFENRVLESQGIKKLEADYKKFGIVNGKYEIIRVNKSKGVVNSLTVKNPKFGVDGRDVAEAIVLIENVISYEAPDSTIKREKKAVVSTLNLSKDKIFEIFGFENVAIKEMTSDEYKNRNFAIHDVLNGKIVSRYESKRNKIIGDFKIRASMAYGERKDIFVILTDKKCDDLKAPSYAK